MSSPAADSAEPRHGAEFGRVKAAILEAMALCDLKNMEDAMGAYLDGAATRLLRQGIIDLSVVWQPLSEDADIGAQRAARVLLFIAMYAEHALNTQLFVPEKARPLVEAELAQGPDLGPQVAALLQAVEQRVQEAQGAAAPVAPPPPGAAAPPRPEKGHGTTRVLKETREAKEWEWDKAKEKEKGKEKAKPRRKFNRGQQLVLGILSLLVFLGVGGYWVSVYLAIRENRLEYEKQQAPLDMSRFSKILPIKEARVRRNVLIVTLDDNGKFAKLPEDQQERIGKSLLRVVNMPGVEQVQVFSGGILFFIERNGSGVVSNSPS